MLVHLRSAEFHPDYLQYVHQDPVHSLTESRSLERRCELDRNIFFWVENNVPTAVLCVAYIQGLTDNIDEILDVVSPVCFKLIMPFFTACFAPTHPAVYKTPVLD